MPSQSGQTPAAIDMFVSQQIRRRRLQIGMSQEVLGQALGISFQQVQKYERGETRISAGRLWLLAEAMNVPVAYFFEGLSDDDRKPGPVRKRYEAKLLRGLAKMPKETRLAFLAFASLWADESRP